MKFYFLNKKTKKNDRRWILCFPCKDQTKDPQKQRGKPGDGTGSRTHLSTLKKSSGDCSHRVSISLAYAGWCFSNRDVCFDIESNEIRGDWSKSLSIESPEEGRCSSYKTKSGREGKASSAHSILLRISWFPPTLVPQSYNAAGSLFSICTFQIFILEGGWIKEMGAWINGWMDG